MLPTSHYLYSEQDMVPDARLTPLRTRPHTASLHGSELLWGNVHVHTQPLLSPHGEIILGRPLRRKRSVCTWEHHGKNVQVTRSPELFLILIPQWDGSRTGRNAQGEGTRIPGRGLQLPVPVKNTVSHTASSVPLSKHNGLLINDRETDSIMFCHLDYLWSLTDNRF